MIRKTRDWRKIRVQDMTTEHIKRAYNKLFDICMCRDYDWEENFDENKYERWKRAFTIELIRRWEFDFIIDKMC